MATHRRSAGGRHPARDTVPELAATPAADRPPGGCERHHLGHGRDASAPVDVAREPTRRVASVAHAQRPRPEPAARCGTAVVLQWLRPQAVAGPVPAGLRSLGAAAATAATGRRCASAATTASATTAASVYGRAASAGTSSATVPPAAAGRRRVCHSVARRRRGQQTPATARLRRHGQQRVRRGRRRRLGRQCGGRASAAARRVRGRETLAPTGDAHAQGQDEDHQLEQDSRQQGETSSTVYPIGDFFPPVRLYCCSRQGDVCF